jgi:gluconate 2-dehydrogenase gamma chain
MTTPELDERERSVLDAVLERLIPADGNGPGAREAAVSRYVLRRLAGPYRRHRDAYAAGLARLDSDANELHGGGFAELTAELQDQVLRAAEARTGDPFFELVLAHAMEGMFGDPAHGGNAEGAGWGLMGYLGPRYVWTESDQRLGRTTG